MSDAVAADQLRLFLERIERLEEEKKGIAEDIRDVYAEAKSQGFDTKTMREIIKLRAMEPNARREREALLDTYKAALGMLDGTPLGKWAMERLKPKKPEPEQPADNDDGQGQPATAPEPEAPPPPPEPELTVEDARRLGGEAAAAGRPVTSNPFPAYDERRAAWDEAWCAALGSDGMDIPDALKPTPKPKKGAPKPGDAE